MNLLGCFLAGTCFGLWPLIMRKSNLPDINQSLMLALPTTAIILAAYFTGVMSGVIFNTFLAATLALGIGVGLGLIPLTVYPIAIIAGMLNGLGTIKLLGNLRAAQQEKASTVILVIVLTQIAVNELCGITMLGADFSIRKALGFVVALGAVYLIATK